MPTSERDDTSGSAPLGESSRTRRILVATFLLFGVLDVFAWRSLVAAHVPRTGLVSKVVFESTGATLSAPAVPWQYPMLPQPSFLDDETLVVPPGYPVSFARGEALSAIEVELYETRTPAMILVERDASGALAFLGLDERGAPRVTDVGEAPPAIAEILAIEACFQPSEDVRFAVSLGASAHDPVRVVGGRCAWELPSTTGRVVVDSPDSSARVEAREGSRLASLSLRLWLIVLLFVASLVHRAPFMSTRLIGTDGTAVVAVLAASFVAPVWVVLWGAKCAAGLLFGAISVVRLAWTRPRLRVALVAAALVVVALVVVVDPVAIAQANNRFNQRGKAAVDTSTSPPSTTTHLVLGASMVNGAALATGAYGDGALDQVLERTCAAPLRTYARYAIDGGSACFLRERWRDASLALPALKDRTFFGGLNDDMTAPAERVGVWLSTIIGVLPNHDPRPRAHAVWQMAAEANLKDARVLDLMACLEGVAGDVPHAPLTHVYELATFDLGRPRRFGREAWVAHRQAALAKHGGQLIDIRSLLPGESPMYFNDFSHLSAIGYAALARTLCEDDRLDPTPGCE